MAEHSWVACSHCQRRAVVCGKCGHNTCNGGYGEVFGPLPGYMVPCDACPSAYALDAKGDLNG